MDKKKIAAQLRAAAHKLEAGSGDLAVTVPAAIDFMGRLSTAAAKAKRDLETKGEAGIGGRGMTEAMSLLYQYRDEEWFDHFFG